MSTLLTRNTIAYKIVTFTMTKGIASKSESSSTFVGSVQPVTGKDLESLVVGREDMGKVKVYSDTQLNVAEEGGNKSGDLVVWQGKDWEVISESAYQNGLIDHWKYICEERGIA